jgi:uncharacterized repeat protein (TIGR01451 family)
VSYNCSLANVTASFTNLAIATGTGPNGNVTAQDTAPVTVFAPLAPPPASTPQITIVKDPKTQNLGIGGTAKFTITVTNTGNVTLSDVTVSDPLSPNCDRNLGTLAVGQSKSYSCTKPNVKDDFQNIATATGKPPTGATVKATDHANITVAPFVPPQNPRIAIAKNPNEQTVTTRITTARGTTGATKTSVSYGTAHFTIKVTNTGNVTLHSVKVTDPLSPACNHSIGTLAAGASKTYNCQRTAVSSSFTNVATATGLSPKGVKVSAKDDANVTVHVKTSSTSGAQFTG